MNKYSSNIVFMERRFLCGSGGIIHLSICPLSEIDWANRITNYSIKTAENVCFYKQHYWIRKSATVATKRRRVYDCMWMLHNYEESKQCQYRNFTRSFLVYYLANAEHYIMWAKEHVFFMRNTTLAFSILYAYYWKFAFYSLFILLAVRLLVIQQYFFSTTIIKSFCAK